MVDQVPRQQLRRSAAGTAVNYVLKCSNFNTIIWVGKSVYFIKHVNTKATATTILPTSACSYKMGQPTNAYCVLVLCQPHPAAAIYWPRLGGPQLRH
jgi:hypothetical protein